MPTTPARVTLVRTADADVRQRQVLVTIDDGPRATMMFGDSVTREVPPGEHLLKVDNTLVRKKVAFTAQPGERIQFQIINRPGRFSFGFLSLLGVAPLFLTVEKSVES